MKYCNSESRLLCKESRESFPTTPSSDESPEPKKEFKPLHTPMGEPSEASRHDDADKWLESTIDQVAMLDTEEAAEQNEVPKAFKELHDYYSGDTYRRHSKKKSVVTLEQFRETVSRLNENSAKQNTGKANVIDDWRKQSSLPKAPDTMTLVLPQPPAEVILDYIDIGRGGKPKDKTMLIKQPFLLRITNEASLVEMDKSVRQMAMFDTMMHHIGSAPKGSTVNIKTFMNPNRFHDQSIEYWLNTVAPRAKEYGMEGKYILDEGGSRDLTFMFSVPGKTPEAPNYLYIKLKSGTGSDTYKVHLARFSPKKPARYDFAGAKEL